LSLLNEDSMGLNLENRIKKYKPSNESLVFILNALDLGGQKLFGVNWV
jgi:hypothetical protein